MNKSPVLTIAIFFIIGIFSGKALSGHIGLIQAFYVFGFFIIAAVIFIRFTKIAHAFLFLSIISLGALLYLNSNIFPNDNIKYFLGENKVKSEVVGIIKSPAEARGVYFGKVGSRYLFQIESVGGLRINGLALVKIKTEKDYQYGDRLLVKGTIGKPSLPKGKKGFNYRQYLERQNIFAIVTASEKNVTLLARNYKVNPVLKFAYFIREKLKNQFLEKMPLESGAFLRAILLGDRSELPKKMNESFRNSGTMHILAISGLNVALLAAAFLSFFKLIRLKREISYSLTMLFLLFLMLLTGSSASVVRATVMCMIFLAGRLLGRQVDGYNSLGTAALFILIVNPKDIFDIGFQLSFIAVLSMIYLTPKLMLLVKKEWNFYLRKYLLEPFSVSVSATVGTFPFILYYFRMGTPIAVISNIFIVPLMFVLMIGGMCFIALGWIPFIGGMLSYFNNALANVIFFLAEFFAGIKFGHFHV